MNPSQFDCKVLDGAAVVHFLKSDTVGTFADYFEKIFMPFIFQLLQDVTRVDFVWDRYLAKSIKGVAREKRGSGVRIKVLAQAKIPKKWNDFLQDSRNKEDLLSFLTECLSLTTVPEGKVIFCYIRLVYERHACMHGPCVLLLYYNFQAMRLCAMAVII